MKRYGLPNGGYALESLKRTAEEDRTVIGRYYMQPGVTLQQWSNSPSAYPIDLKSLIVERARGRNGHNHIADLAELDDQCTFAMAVDKFGDRINSLIQVPLEARIYHTANDILEIITGDQAARDNRLWV